MKHTLRRLCTALALLAALPWTAAPARAEAISFTTDYQAIDEAAQSVLMLYWEDAFYVYTGSAFVAFDEDKLLTNYHVIEGVEDEIYAYGDDGTTYVIDRVYIADRDRDLAIVGFSQPTGIPPLNLGDTRGLLRAEPVVAIGSPKGQKNTVSLGNVSGMFEEGGVRYVQFTAPISSGSSGGALFDNRGNVIGITSAYIFDAQNINIAVDISEAKALYEKIEYPEGLAFHDYWEQERSLAAAARATSYSDFAARGFHDGAVTLFWCDRGRNISLITTEKHEFTAAELDDFRSSFAERDYYSTLSFSLDAADADSVAEVELELTLPSGRTQSVTERLRFIAAARSGAMISTNVNGLMSFINGGGVYRLAYKLDGREIAAGTFEILGEPASERGKMAPNAPQETPRGRFSGGATPAPTATPEPEPAAASPGPTATPTPEDGGLRALNPGDRGDEVRRLQAALIELGYLDDRADGIYGARTENAVRNFQRVNGLRGVFYGTADEKTLALLYSGEALPYADPEVVLTIDRDSDLDWYGDGSDCEMCLRLVNTGRRKTVVGYTMYYCITNAGGEVELEDEVSISQRIAPGQAVTSRRIAVSETKDSYEIRIAITSVTYDDGTTVEIQRPDYRWWWM